MTPRTLSRTAAKRYYDRFGSRQDSQGWYEDPAIDDLIRASRFPDARAVLELGCGTGRVAELLLDRHLPASATYTGIDISDTMVALGRKRLARFRDRATVILNEGTDFPSLPHGSADRFLCTYVLDLLPVARIEDALDCAFRALTPGGLLCLAGITKGRGVVSRAVMAMWRLVFTLNPAWLGGCRPLVLGSYLAADRWAIEHRRVIVARGIASEVVVARRANRM